MGYDQMDTPRRVVAAFDAWVEARLDKPQPITLDLAMMNPTTQDKRPGAQERHAGRRVYDAPVMALAKTVARATPWLNHIRAVIVFGIGLVAGAAGLSSWLGGKYSGPGLRQLELEQRVDSGFHALRATLARLEANQAKYERDHSDLELKIDDLLIIGCRQVQRDLVRSCRLLGR